jgi:hypothetical protein
MNRSFRLVALVLCAAPSMASAQGMIEPAPVPMPPPPPRVYAPAPPRVYVAPAPRAYYAPRPRVYVAPPPPPIYYGSPGAVPPHVYIRERIRWHLRHLLPRVYMAPPPVVYAAPVAPPAEYAPPPVAPMPPIPPPVVVPPPCCYGPPVEAAPAQELVLVKPRPSVPMWSSRIGLGVRGTGQVINDGWNNLGIGGEFLYRASPHLVTELAVEYQRSTATPLDRVDIPVTFGLRVHIGRPTWVVSPYFVFAGGFSYASQDLKFTSDDAIYVEGQLGGGLELRLGQHVAITFDARLDAKKRANSPAENVLATASVDGKPVHALGDEVGGQFRLGVAAYF